MAAATDVKQLLLQVDASVELLRRNLNAGQSRVDQFAGDTQRRLDAVDRRFGEVGRPLGNLNTSIAATRRQIATIGTSVSQTEASVRRSADGMKAALLGSAAGIAAAFSANRVKDYADSYTRFTNSLTTAELAGQRLTKAQDGLFAVAQRNGVQLEALGNLYGNVASLQKDLNASDADTLKVSSAVAAALKIKGASAEQASGAILGLTQALGNGKFQAEEFNQINDGARPLLQAAADASDKYRGSLGKLRQDVLAGTVTSKDLFAMIVAGADSLEGKASKATLTFGASFTALNNALSRFVGETDKSLGATERLTGGISLLADNLDTIIPALTTIALAYGSVKAAGLAFGAVTAVTASVLGVERDLARQLVLRNATYVNGATLAATSAQVAAASAAAEVSSIESTIAARKAEQVVLGEQIAAERALIVERRAAAQAAAVSLTQGGLNNRSGALAAQAAANNDATFATQRLAAARQRLAAVDGELAIAEGGLAAAQTRAAAATNVAAAAATRATLASQAGAAASRLFAGALTLIGGSVAGGAAVLAIGALVGAIVLYNSSANSAEERSKATGAALKDTAARGKELNAALAATAAQGAAASSGINQVGGSAVAATGKMLAFAGAIGEAAEKLRLLAIARRREETLRYASISTAADFEADKARQRMGARQAVTNGVAGGSVLGLVLGVGGGGLSNNDKANADDARIISESRAQAAAARAAARRAAQVPLDQRIRESDRNGGRDVDGELARVTRDLVVARERGIRATVDTLEAQKFELTQYKKYRKDGLSPEAAQQAASSDAGSFRSASAGAQGDRNSRAGAAAQSKAERAAAAAGRRQQAEVRDAAADERAYSSAERQANNDIAAARADLTNSAVERAQIEKDRIEGERQNRDNEIAQQAKQGGLGTGAVAETRKLELQSLNAQRAKLETDVVDARERQRVADEALTVASAGRANDTELLQKQGELITSASQRRDLEQRILSIQYQEERAKLEGVIASRDTTEAEKKIAQQRLGMLGQLQAADQSGIDRRSAGPLDQYRERLRAAAGDTNEALQGVAVDGLENLENGLLGIINGTEDVGSAFKKMASSIIADLARIAIEKAIISSIGGSFFGLSTGGKIEGKATGGRISGPGTGTSDSIFALIDGKDPLMVSNGESIVTAAATAQYWPIIDAMNKGTFRLPGLATGGPVKGRFAAAAPSMSSLPAFSRGGGDRVSIPITIDARGADQAAVARLDESLSQLRRDLPGEVLKTYADAKTRRII